MLKKTICAMFVSMNCHNSSLRVEAAADILREAFEKEQERILGTNDAHITSDVPMSIDGLDSVLKARAKLLREAHLSGQQVYCPTRTGKSTTYSLMYSGLRKSPCVVTIPNA